MQPEVLAEDLFAAVKVYCAGEIDRRMAAYAQRMAAQPVPKDGRDGRDGKDGEAGRDAAALEVLDAIHPERSYARGTWACCRGGLVRAVRQTEPLPEGGALERAGWQVVVRGVDDIAFGLEGRVSTVKLTLTDGAADTHALHWPMLIYRGVFTPGDYEPGDTVTYAGQLYHCNLPTSERPDIGAPVWTLAVRHGRDAKNGGR
jgi:hypothetical protein